MAPSDVGVVDRLVSACAGSLATAFTVTPLDVAKVQMQAAQATHDDCAGVCAARHAGSDRFFISNGLSEHCFEKSDPRFRHCFQIQRSGPPLGLLGTLRQIMVGEGFRGLYAGLPATLLLAVPANVVYFAAYEKFRDGIAASPSVAVLAPLIAGGSARFVSATACAPLEILRTQSQAGRLANHNPAERRLASLLQRLLAEEGPRGLFRGLSSTLWRDVPFSGLYWAGVEAVRGTMAQNGWWEDSPMQAPLLAISSASLAGGAAALVTTPFDVVKTRQQLKSGVSSGIHDAPRSLLQTLVQIARQGGPTSLFAGGTPRVARVAPACAIMLGSYELTKVILRPV